MKLSEWREELKAAEASVEREAEGLAAAKDAVRSRLKELGRARRRMDEVLRAFISGESQTPLFDAEGRVDPEVEPESEAGALVGDEPWLVAGGPFSESLLELVREACYSNERLDWGDLRRDGATDPELLDKLTGYWPPDPYVLSADGGKRYTIRGGEEPAFWPFDCLPAGASLPARPYLTGPALCLAIRQAMRLKDQEPRRSTADKVPDEHPDDALLRRALHSTQGAAERWAASIAAGETDASLKARIATEFGNRGGGDGYEVAVGSSHRIWFSPKSQSDKPSLQGKVLVSEVRRLLRIPYPKGGAK